MAGMSNHVFPSLPNRVWPIERESVWVNPQTETSANGREFTTTQETYPRLRYSFGYAGLVKADIDTLLDFWSTHKGKTDSFLFEDPLDKTVTLEPIGTGNGAVTAWQLGRSRSSGPASFLQPIFDLNGAPLIYVAGTLRTSGYTVSATGMLTFTTAPTSGQAIAWSGNFYHRCRFDMGDMTASQFTQTLHRAKVQIITRKP